MQPPLVTVAVISFNRLKYLRATLESLRRCLIYPNLQWIIIDGNSLESGLSDYLNSLAWVDQVVSETCSHAEAMNRAVTLAKGDVLLLWPDDVQFTVAGKWMEGFIEILMANREYASISLNYLRRSSVKRVWGEANRSWPRWAGYMMPWGPKHPIVSSSKGWRCISYGDAREGIIGSGIPSLTRTEIWRQLGPWKTATAGNMIDSGGGEDEMLARFRHSPLKSMKRLHPIVPVAADIVDDEIGCKAKVRGGKRYGIYMTPPDGIFYYRIRDELEVKALNSNSCPLAFEEMVEPIGYKLPLDDKGDLLKGSINQSMVSEIG